jgi:putative transposase
VDFIRVGFGVSERRACRVIGCHRKTYRYQSRAQDQTALRPATARAGECPGALRLPPTAYPAVPRRLAGQPQMGYRLYRLDGLSVRYTVRRKRASALRPLLPTAQAPNEQWSMDAHERAAWQTGNDSDC